MTRAAHDEILRLTRLRYGAELELRILGGRSSLGAAEAGKLRELEQRRRQLLARIAWFRALLSEPASAAE